MTKLEAHGKGDINDDGKIDLRDLMMCLNHVGGKEELEGEQFERADINSDEEVNIVDLMKLLNHVGRKALLNGELELNINVNYFNRKLTLWASNANDQEQPVVIPEQENVSIPTKLTTSPSFDLALRKYITKINGEELIGQNTRVPSIDESTLQSGTTATYNHKKDPVAVETGNIVTYNITIYNEGNKEGRATKIVDQLPEGVKFSKVVSGNFELGNYDKTTNRVTLNRKTDNTENLAVYEAGKLDSETIEIECEVTATADNQEKVLTNVAWIEEEYDAIDNVTITNQEGADIDSEPETKPEVNKDNMENYTGKEEHEDLTNPEMYYKGQQDDDDFEKLILEKAEGNYTIDLVKQDGETKDKLSGAIFNVNGEDKTATNVDGVINLGTVEITNIEEPDVYVIKETSSPSGYNKFEGSIELSIAKKLENGKYVVDTENTRMVVKNSEGTEITENVPVAIDKTTGKITVTVDNEKTEGKYDLEILKVDKDNNEKVLEGAGFKITLADSTEKTEKTNAEGKILIEGIKITAEGKEIIKIEETESPEGYNKIFNSVELEVTKEIKNGKYVVSNIELKNAEGTGIEEGEIKANLENGKITLTIPNKKTEGNYTIDLVKQDGETKDKLSGAIFNVNGEDKTATNVDGVINLGTVEITNIEEPDVYVIKETSSPSGYNKFEGSIELSIAKKLENGKYVVDTENTRMVVKNSEGTEITENVPVAIDKTTGKITVTVDNEKTEGKYDLEILKVDKDNNEKVLEGAGFKITLADSTEKTEKTNAEGKILIEGIKITAEGKEIIKIEETESPEGYNKIFNSVELEVTKEIKNGKYVVSNIELKNAEGTGIEEGEIKANLENGKITLTIPNKKTEGNYTIDLVKQDGETKDKLSGAIFNVNGEDKTATNVDGVINLGTVEITNIEEPDVYVIKETSSPSGYNKFEGSIELSIAKKLENGKYVVDTENTRMVVKNSEGTEITENVPVAIDKTTGKITITVDNKKTEGNYTIDLVKQDGETKDKLSGAIFNVNGEDKTATNVDGVINLGTVEITNIEEPDVYVIKETSSPSGYNKFEGSIELSIAKKLENGKYVVDTENTRMVVKNSEGTEITENVPVAIDKTTGKITITIDNEKKEFDLALRKFIIAVSNDETIEENEYLRNEDGTYTREPFVDTSLLNTKDEEGNLITTATYNHSKEPIYVRKGDIVIYTIRVYNEGEINGYAQQVTDYLPEELEFLPDHEINQQYEWTIEGNKISTDYLSKEKETEERENLIQSFDGDIYYKDVQIACKVKDDVKTSWKITNLAQITEDSNQNGDEENDRDSTPDGGFDEPEGEERPIYKDDETGEYIPGQEDDDDFEKILVEEFDLALRKFIIAVSEDETIEENEYLKNEDGSYTREPIVDTSKLNTKDEEGNLITTAKYNHTKESILVQKNDIVIYMLRVYNEGDINGYAAEIKDHLPPYLEYVDSEFNNQYGWEVSEDGRTLTTRYLEDSLINKPEVNEEGEYKLSYQEVPVMCRVMESVPTNEEITNIADITEYQDDKKEETIDRDSESDNIELPDDENLPEYQDEKIKNGDEYIPGQEDDDDFEKIIVKEFDLALRKWVTEAIVIENGQQTITTTGHEPYDEPEEIVKVELHRKKLNQVEVKFRYKIRVTNEGDIAGYVKEITDYIPEGLKFVAEDNPGWTDEGNNVISTTLTESILLQPGEYTEVEVVLTWINSEDNMGVMTNIAEISKDENEYGIPDKDSTPDNQRQGEDDIDDAPVMLSISTGKAVTYFMLGVVVLITIAGGIILIKKFVI